MRLSFVADNSTPVAIEEEVTPSDLIELFTATVGQKDGTAFIPAVLHTPYRQNANVTSLTALVLDCDDWADDAFDALVDELRTDGVEFYYYETHGHRPGSGVTRARVVLPFAEPCPAELWGSAWPKLTADVLRQFPKPDESCKEPARLYYLPRHPAGEQRASEYVPGYLYDWKSQGPFTAAPPAPPRVDTHDARPATPATLAAAEADARKYLETLTEDPTTPGNPVLEKLGAHIINTWGIPLEQAIPIGERLNSLLPRPKQSREEWEEPFTNGGRYARGLYGEKRQAFELMASRVLPTTPAPAAPALGGFHLEVLRNIIARVKGPQAERLLAGRRIRGKKDATRGQWVQLIHAITDEMLRAGQLEWPLEMLWQQVESSARLEAAPPDREWFDTQWNEARLTAVARQAAARVEHESHCLRRAQEILSITTGEPEPVDDPAWLARCIDAKGNVPATACSAMLAAALQHSARWGGIRFDTFKRRYERDGEVVEIDDLLSDLGVWCSQRGLPFKTEAALLALRQVRQLNCYDSLVDAWDALPEWDGVERLKTFAKDYLRAEIDAGTERYHEEACRRWFIAMAARAYRPGAKVDDALILYSGQQGQNKTQLFELLGGDGYLSTELGRDQMARRLKGKSVVELNEFGYATHLTVEKVKAWLSNRSDADRGMYEHDFIDLPRRFVLGGSTNNPAMLADESGNRRFWVIEVGLIDKARVQADLQQLRAEAKHEYLRGERWWFAEEETDLRLAQSKVASAHTETDTVEPIIEEAILSVQPDQREEWIDADWVLRNAQPSPGQRLERTDERLARRITKALRKMFGPPKQSRRWGRARRYQLTAEMLTAPYRPAIGALVPNRSTTT